MICPKCRCTQFKWLENYYCCVQCGALIDVTIPVVTKIPKGNPKMSTFKGRSIASVAADNRKEVQERWDELLGHYNNGKRFRWMCDTLDMGMGRLALEKHFMEEFQRISLTK